MKKTVSDIDVTSKKVLVRVDFNVPHKGPEITDNNRIVAALDTICDLLNRNAKVVLMSHLGKVEWKKLAKGEKTEEDIQKQMAKNSLSIVTNELKKLLSERLKRDVVVNFSDETSGFPLMQKINELEDGQVLLVENTRYEEGEEANDPNLAGQWAYPIDVFVMDAFGSAHRAHASTVGLPAALKAQGKETAVGYLVEKEIKGLGRCVEPKADERPYVAILGGAKVSSKIEVIDSLLKKCDKILIGGGMAYTFLKAVYGIDVGDSLLEEDQIEYAKKCYATGKIVLPIDTVVAKGIDFDNLEAKINKKDIDVVKQGKNFPKGYQGVDIGPKTISAFEKEILKAKTIFWNGPMGIFENDDFAKGTIEVCKACVKNKKAFSVIGGGDSAAAAKKFGYNDKFSHVSTGGGASLELIQFDGHLPGIDVIEDVPGTEDVKVEQASVEETVSSEEGFVSDEAAPESEVEVEVSVEENKEEADASSVLEEAKTIFENEETQEEPIKPEPTEDVKVEEKPVEEEGFVSDEVPAENEVKVEPETVSQPQEEVKVEEAAPVEETPVEPETKVEETVVEEQPAVEEKKVEEVKDEDVFASEEEAKSEESSEPALDDDVPHMRRPDKKHRRRF